MKKKKRTATGIEPPSKKPARCEPALSQNGNTFSRTLIRDFHKFWGGGAIIEIRQKKAPPSAVLRANGG